MHISYLKSYYDHFILIVTWRTTFLGKQFGFLMFLSQQFTEVGHLFRTMAGIELEHNNSMMHVWNLFSHRSLIHCDMMSITNWHQWFCDIGFKKIAIGQKRWLTAVNCWPCNKKKVARKGSIFGLRLII